MLPRQHAKLMQTHIIRLTPAVVMTMTPAGADRYRHDASLSSDGNSQKQQHDPQIAHGPHLLGSSDEQEGVSILEGALADTYRTGVIKSA